MPQIGLQVTLTMDQFYQLVQVHVICSEYCQLSTRLLRHASKMKPHALTCYTCIFTMPTVVAVDPTVAAFQKRCFPSSAPQVIKEYLSGALTKMSTLMGCYCSSVSKLAAYNLCITNVPEVITNSVPLIVVPNFNSSFSCFISTN